MVEDRPVLSPPQVQYYTFGPIGAQEIGSGNQTTTILNKLGNQELVYLPDTKPPNSDQIHMFNSFDDT
jgi:hypothetical protein